MLQQILQDMYVDPVLLACLPDDQRRVLYSKMREEQVRRYNAWIQAESPKFLKPRLPPKPGKKRVRFVMGKDGEPLATIVGEAEEDYSLSSSEDELGVGVEDAVRLDSNVGEKRAKILEDDEEDEEVRVTLLQSERFIKDMEQSEEKKKREWLAKKQEQLKARQDTLQKISDGLSQTSIRKEEPVVTKETRSGVAANGEITKTWEKNKIKELAVKAMVLHKMLQDNQKDETAAVTGNNKYNASKRQFSLPVSRTKSRPDKPPSRAAIVEWFRNSEIHRVVAIDPVTGHVSDWFHGMTSRLDAEKLLLSQPTGTYLIRLSERIWGYAVSYRTPEKCKHFLINATTNFYQFFGDDNSQHESLAALVQHHRVHPISEAGQEYLLTACPHPTVNPNLWELFD